MIRRLTQKQLMVNMYLDLQQVIMLGQIYLWLAININITVLGTESYGTLTKQGACLHFIICKKLLILQMKVFFCILSKSLILLKQL